MSITDPKPNVVILFYGIMRSLRHVLPSIQTNIFTPLTKNGIAFDTVIHTYTETTLHNTRSHEHCDDLQPHDAYRVASRVIMTSQSDFLSTVSLDSYLSHGDPWDETHHTSLKNLLCQLNSLSIVYRYREKDYTCYLLLRSDLEFITPLDIQPILSILHSSSTSSSRIMYTPKWGQFRGLNDRMCICNHSAIPFIADRLYDLLTYSHMAKPHSESFLLYIARTYNIENRMLQCRAVRVRCDRHKEHLDRTMK